jgi:two-component system sensor histidine kinase HydH
MTDTIDTWHGLPLRHWGLFAGVLTGVLDTAILSGLGVSFHINTWDAWPLIATYFGASFAALGYLLGSVVEGQRRERRAAALVQAQSEMIAAVHARLAQSEKLAALGQLAATIAHEVRNPLGIMRSAAQTMNERLPTGDASAEASAFIIAEIDRLANVVNSLLGFARPLQIDARSVAVAELFERAALLSRAAVDAKRIRLECRGSGAVVYGDPDLLAQVLLGLVHNAAEAVPAGGVIALTAAAADGIVRIAVADSGPGVTPALRARIFEPFFTTRASGTGLGLPIARQIVAAHHGRIEIDDAAEGGARFTIMLPAPSGAALAA